MKKIKEREEILFYQEPAYTTIMNRNMRSFILIFITTLALIKFYKDHSKSLYEIRAAKFLIPAKLLNINSK